MGSLTIYKDDSADFTILSNRFIDEYMTDANDAQIKVYLYLVRAFSAHMPVSVSALADRFNHTEKDIMRALKYWEKKGLLSLDYDGAKSLCGIHMLTPSPALEKTPSVNSSAQPPEAKTAQPAEGGPSTFTAPSQAEKPSYSLDDLKAFQAQEEAAQLLFIVEQYIGKPLTLSEMKTILFIYDHLDFSADLVDYLVQYCVDRGIRSFRYIEKVAISWAEAHITTPRQAKIHAQKYDKTVFPIMKALGKSGMPTSREISYISRWTKELGFTMEVINEACERTVLAVDKHRFEYADKILSSWNTSQVHSVGDVQSLDEAYRKSSSRARGGAAKNAFNEFPQREYNYEELEKELLSN